MTTIVNKSNGQLGVAATLVSTQTYAQTSTTGVSNTGNDYITGTINSGANNVKMNVAVCDGSAPQLMWHYYDNSLSSPYTQTGYITLNPYAFDPDVCLLFREDRFFAVVVYSDGVNGFSYLECYEYDVSNNTFAFTAQIGQITLGTNIATAINIDSDQRDHFAAVWDEASTNSNSHCFIVAGNWSNTFHEPVICSNYNPGVLLPRLTDNSSNLLPLPYKMPDIGVFDETNSVADYIITVITDDDEVAVYDIIRKNNVCNNSLSSSLTAGYYNSVSGHIFTWPRVARHRHVGTTLQEGYTVVYGDYTVANGSYDIDGRTNFYDATNSIFINTDNIYTDGNNAWFNHANNYKLPAINNNVLYKPVVSYERQSGSTNPITSQHFVVAFNANDGTGIYPLALYAYNSDGTPYTSQSIYDFNQVPILGSAHDEHDIISVAGEQSHVFLYSWYDIDNSNMSYKLVTSGNKFKTGTFENTESTYKCLWYSKETNSYYLPKNISESNNIQIIDLNGHLLYSQNSFYQTNFLSAINNLCNGIYIVSLAANNQQQNLKLVIQ